SRAHELRVSAARVSDAARGRGALESADHRGALRRGFRARQQRDRGVHRPAAPQARPRRGVQADRDAARARLPVRLGPRRRARVLTVSSARMALFRSLRVRVIVWVSVALTVLFAITVAGLDITFRRSTDQALRDLLEVQVLGLVALAEADEAGSLTLRADGADPQFQVVDSGLYGVLLDAEGRVLWRSQSLLEAELPLGQPPAPGEQRFFTAEPPELPPLAG